MQRVFLYSLIAIVGLSPLPFGANRLVSWSALGVLVSVLLLAWAAHQLLTKSTLPVPVHRVKFPLILFGGACLWVLIQLIPGIPFGMANPGWQEVGVFFSEDVPGRVTIDPDWTIAVLMRWVTYAAVFWLALQLCRDRANANIAFGSLVIIGGAYALYGLIEHLSGSTMILFYEKWSGRGILSSSFVNSNTYATYAGMGLIAAASLALRRAGHAAGRLSGFKDRVLSFLDFSQVQNSYPYLCFFLIGTACILTGSRGGVLSTLAGGAALLMLQFVGARRGVAPRSMKRVALIGLISVVVVAVGGGLLAEKLNHDGSEIRLSVYSQTLYAIQDHALVGSGLGSFPQLFPLYRAQGDQSFAFLEKAHNSYLENTLELGIPAAGLFYLSLATLVWLCWRGTRVRSRGRHFSMTGVAVSVLVGLHSIVDFSMQVPAVALTYMFIMGIAVAQSFSSKSSLGRHNG